MKFLSRIIVIASLILIFLASLLSACGQAPDLSVQQSLVAGSVPAAVVDPQPDDQAPSPPKLRRHPQEPAKAASVEASPLVNPDSMMSSPDYGMQVFLYWREEIADRDLQLVKDAGFRWVKQEMAWRELEGGGKGKWRWNISDRVVDQIEAHGLNAIVRLGAQPEWASSTVTFPEIGPPDSMQDFYDYVYAVANRYEGRIKGYQIWNEPNLAREWGHRPPSPAEYVGLLKTGYQAVKAADPNAMVISAGMAPTTRNDHEAMPDVYFIQGMYEAGAESYFDALGVHAAGFKSPPEADPAVVAQDPVLTNGDSAPAELRRVYAFRHVEDIRRLMVDNDDADKKIVVLEFGWTVDSRPDSPYRWHAVTPEQQDQYLQRAYAYAAENWQPWIGVMSLIYIADPSWTIFDEQTYWSIVYPGYPELRTAPAYYGLFYMDKVPPAASEVR